MTLQAFLNSDKIKTKYVQRLEEHYKQDEIIKGTYWEDGKGCAVGCTVHSNNHNCYEIELGIPIWVARLEDVLFEGMLNEDAKEFPLLFLKSIPIGFDNWQHIYHQLCLHILEKECKNIEHPLVKQAICDIMTLHRTEETDQTKWSAARSAAWSAARSAWSAESATWSAESAQSAAWSARSAARSAESAARSAESAAARSAAYKSIADKLLELLEA